MVRSRSLPNTLALLAICVGVAPTVAGLPSDKMEYPIAVAVGRGGRIYIADQHAQTIYSLADNKLSVVYKGSKKYRTPLYRAKAMVEDKSGNLFVCDTGSMDVWRIDPKSQLKPMTGKKLDEEGSEFDREARYAGLFDKPMAITLDADGNPIVADLGLGAIFRLSPDGGEPEEIARVPAPRGITRDPDGSLVVVSHGRDNLVRVSTDGKVSPIVKGSIAPKGVLSFPHNVVAVENGYVVSDGYARALWRISSDGKVQPLLQGDPLRNPVGLAREPGGDLLVIDTRAKALFRVTLDGAVSRVLPAE